MWPRRQANQESNASSTSKAKHESVSAQKKIPKDDSSWIMRAYEKKKQAKKAQKKRPRTDSNPPNTNKRPAAAISKASIGIATTSESMKENEKPKKILPQQLQCQVETFDDVFNEVFAVSSKAPPLSRNHHAFYSEIEEQENLQIQQQQYQDEYQDFSSWGQESSTVSTLKIQSDTAAKAKVKAKAKAKAKEEEEEEAWTFGDENEIAGDGDGFIVEGLSGDLLDDFSSSKNGNEMDPALLKYKRSNASHAVSDNFVRSNPTRRRMKGSTGRAKKLPSYLRNRGRSGFKMTQEDIELLTDKQQTKIESDVPLGSKSLTEGIDFIEECVQMLNNYELHHHQQQQQQQQHPQPVTAPPRCHHGHVAILLIVKKKNKNHGKHFFACPLGFEEGKCDFFLWEEDHVPVALQTLWSSSSHIEENEAGSSYIPLDWSRSIEEQEEILVQNLRLVFEHENFRDGQLWAIKRILQRKSSLLVLPTGGGKSLCYQLPALLLPGLTIVVSPLISLMNDQFQSLPLVLKAQTAHFCQTSKQKQAEIVRKLYANQLKLLLVSPERLLSAGFQRMLTNFKQEISLLCIDEAHCVSEWSHHFRPAFLRLHSMVKKVKSVLAITATASPSVLQDLSKQLIVGHTENKQDEYLLKLPWHRQNLRLHVCHLKTEEQKHQQLIRLIGSLFGIFTTSHSSTKEEYQEIELERTSRKKTAGTSSSTSSSTSRSSSTKTTTTTGGTIVYVHQQRQAEEIACLLQQTLGHNSNSRTSIQKQIAFYHAGMDPTTKEKIRIGFLKGKIKVVIATIAFGMGIDKKNVRNVIHLQPPNSFENYVQQIGRAGRDGKQSTCVLFMIPQDFVQFYTLQQSHRIVLDQIQKLCRLLLLEEVEDMYLTRKKEEEEEENMLERVCIIRQQNDKEKKIKVFEKTVGIQWLSEQLDMKPETIETFLSLLSTHGTFSFQYQASLNAICMVQFLANDIATTTTTNRDQQLEEFKQFRKQLIQLTEKSGGQMSTKTEGYHSQVTLKFSLLQMTQLLGYQHNSQSESEEAHLLKKLRQLQQNALIQRVSLETFSFRYVHEEIGQEKGPKLDEIVAYLHEKSQRLEKLHTNRLVLFFQALKDQALGTSSDDTLERSISKYFEQKQEEETKQPMKRQEFLYEMGFEKLTIDKIQMIEKTVRNFLQEENERLFSLRNLRSAQWSSLCITKIFQGLSSVCFPAKEWHTSRFWRSLLQFPFDQVLYIVHKILLEEEEIDQLI